MKPPKKDIKPKEKDSAKAPVRHLKKQPPKLHDTHCPFFGAKLM